MRNFALVVCLGLASQASALRSKPTHNAASHLSHRPKRVPAWMPCWRSGKRT